MTNSTTDLFTPPPGTVFVLDGFLTLRALRYEGGERGTLVCVRHRDSADDPEEVFISGEARADLLQFLVLDAQGVN